MNRAGSALLLTLWLTLALSLLVSVFAYSVNQEVQWTSWQRKRKEAGYLADSALQYLPKLIEDQRKQIAFGGKPQETQLDLERFPGFWKSPEFSLGHGKFRLEVRDVGQKLNVNLTPPEIWQAFLHFTTLDEDDSRVWIDSLQDWIDSNDASRLNGAEDEFYRRSKPPYRAKNAPVSTIGEIMWIRKGPEMLEARLRQDLTGHSDRVADFLTVEGDGKININTAPAVILAALGQTDIQTAEAWMRQRNGPDGLPGTADDQSPETSLFQADDSSTSIVTKRSDYFIVEGVGEVGGVEAVHRALFKRDGQQLVKVRDLGEENS